VEINDHQRDSESEDIQHQYEGSLKRGFHSNARNTRNVRKALRKKKYTSKIKSTQEMQLTQENNASKKQKYASASHATDASGPYVRTCNDRIDSIFHSTNASGSQ